MNDGPVTLEIEVGSRQALVVALGAGYSLAVTFGMRVAVTVAALVTSVLPLVGCGGDAGNSDMLLTLTDLDCTYEGDETPQAGTFSVELVNDSSTPGNFALYTIAAGSEFSDVQAYVEQERQRIAQGAEPLGPPDFLSLVTREDVATGDRGTLSSDLIAGTYALICQHDQPPTAVSLVKPPLEVSG